MNRYKTFIALGLSGLISVCSASSLDWITNQDGGKELIFTSTNDVFTPTPNPMTISSGNYEITTDGELEYFSIVGSFVIDGGHLTINPKGNSKIYTSSMEIQYYKDQHLTFNCSRDPLQKCTNPYITIQNGILDFVTEGESGKPQKQYDILLGYQTTDGNADLINDTNGYINFSPKNNSKLSILGEIENRGEINIVPKDNAHIQVDKIINSGKVVARASDDVFLGLNLVNSGNAEIHFDRIIDSTSFLKGILIIETQGEGKTTVNIMDTHGLPDKKSPMTFSAEIDNTQAKEGSVIFNINNSSNFLLSLKSSDATQKQVSTLVNYQSNTNSTLELGVGNNELKSTKVIFSGSNNKVFFFNYDDFEKDGCQTNETNILNIKNNGDGNFVSFLNHDALYRVYNPSYQYWVSPIESSFYVLTIGEKGDDTTGLEGSGLNFIVKANPRAPQTLEDKNNVTTLGGDLLTAGQFAYADKVVIHSSVGGKGGSHNLGVGLFNPQDANLIFYTPKTEGGKDGDISIEHNILIASVAKSSNITLNPIQDSIVGFNLVSIGFVEVDTDESGIHHGDSQDTYTSYFLSSAKDLGVSVVNQEITTTALALNYDLFIGNFNSLNKRMGDLRNNPYNQGAWGRIFNGQISNDFTSSKNNYTTIQLGYDHKLGNFENASNYLGVAIDYSFAFSESSINASNALQSRTIQDVYSNAFEVAIYNSYIQDEGWFSDSIAKFSYLDSSFNIADNLANTSENQNTSNVAFTLSEEFGYRFKLGENKTWFVDPQLEVAMGYFSGTDLKQVAGSYFLDAKSDGMFMTRARFGASAGYDFKDFTQGKDFKAVVYAGLSCEADLLSGGDVTLTPSSGQGDIVNSLYSSDFRGVLNIGTNVEIRENIRVYADIQTSFGGKISNDYQINLGARFSFGEKGESNTLMEKKNAQ